MKSRSSTKGKLSLYRGFSGLNTSTADVALEVEDAQAFVRMDNLYCSPNGYLSNERALTRVGAEQSRVTHIRFYANRKDALVYAAEMAGGLFLKALDRPHISTPSLPKGTKVTSCVFNREAVFTLGEGRLPRIFDGDTWTEIVAPEAEGARYCCAVANRLVLAGFTKNPTEVLVSRVNEANTMPSEEDPAEASIIKAFRFNIGGMLGTADTIRGVAPLGRDGLAIFTKDRMLAYKASANLTEWTIDETVNVNVGTISHNTLTPVGDELFFCSRAGVHSLRRSSLNGNTVFTLPLSRDVEELYRSLSQAVKDPEQIAAFFDQDNGRYTVMFPFHDALSVRLHLDIVPKAQDEVSTIGAWSLSTHAGLICADSLGGETVFGSISGFKRLEAEYDPGERGPGEALTPILWHGDILEPKSTQNLVLYASGSGTVSIDAEDETGRQLGTFVFELAEPGRADSIGFPLPKQFTRTFQHTYSGLRLRVRIASGSKQVRVFAIGVQLREI